MAVQGVFGSIQANEVVKLRGTGPEVLAGPLLIWTDTGVPVELSGLKHRCPYVGI
jgi:hypothetical protein